MERRQFLRNALTGIAGAAALPFGAVAKPEPERKLKIVCGPDSKIWNVTIDSHGIAPNGAGAVIENVTFICE